MLHDTTPYIKTPIHEKLLELPGEILQMKFSLLLRDEGFDFDKQRTVYFIKRKRK